MFIQIAIGIEIDFRRSADWISFVLQLDWGAHTVDLCQWANRSDDTTPVVFEPSANCITARYANGVNLVLDYLNTAFGDRSPQYITRLGTCPVRFEGENSWVETVDSGDIEVEFILKEQRKRVAHRAGTLAHEGFVELLDGQTSGLRVQRVEGVGVNKDQRHEPLAVGDISYRARMASRHVYILNLVPGTPRYLATLDRADRRPSMARLSSKAAK